MRIISQNGAIDVPYEHTTLIREGTEIYLSSIKLRDTLIAKYSTEEKAVKAMEMCRRYYDNRSSVTEPKIFQFPVDKEVRV